MGVDGAPAGGDDGVLEIEALQHLILNLDESGGAQPIDQTLERLIAALLYHQVDINEVIVQDLRQYDADGGFA